MAAFAVLAAFPAPLLAFVAGGASATAGAGRGGAAAGASDGTGADPLSSASGVSFEQTYLARLEKDLNGRGGLPPVEIVKAGVGGFFPAAQAPLFVSNPENGLKNVKTSVSEAPAFADANNGVTMTMDSRCMTQA